MADGDVHIIAPKICQRHARTHVEIDVGMRCKKPAHPRQEPTRRKRGQDAHPQLSRIASLGHFAHRFRELCQCDTHAAGEALALVGQSDSAPGALDQAHAEIGFQRLDLMADGTMREMQRLGRFGQALHTRRGF